MKKFELVVDYKGFLTRREERALAAAMSAVLAAEATIGVGLIAATIEADGPTAAANAAASLTAEFLAAIGFIWALPGGAHHPVVRVDNVRRRVNAPAGWAGPAPIEARERALKVWA